jgi:AraC-like DNA-binding protein
MDHLSEVFDLVEIRGLLTGGFATRGAWVSRGTLDGPLKIIAMVSGRARLTTDGSDPLDLEPGDVAILNNRSWLELAGFGDGPRHEIVPTEGFPGLIGAVQGSDDAVVGGRIDLNPAGEALLRTLPAAGLVQGAALRGCLHRLFEEVTRPRLGSAFAIRQYGQLVLLEVLRAYVEQAELPPGWLRVLTDERLRPAISRMHADPGKPWGLTELARTAAMSRTSFAERFRTVAGTPPLTYLNRWRMLLAQRALRDSEIRVGALAADLGYGSESAFSTAFKREVGESPLRYRYRVRSTGRT